MTLRQLSRLHPYVIVLLGVALAWTTQLSPWVRGAGRLVALPLGAIVAALVLGALVRSRWWRSRTVWAWLAFWIVWAASLPWTLRPAPMPAPDPVGLAHELEQVASGMKHPIDVPALSGRDEVTQLALAAVVTGAMLLLAGGTRRGVLAFRATWLVVVWTTAPVALREIITDEHIITTRWGVWSFAPHIPAGPFQNPNNYASVLACAVGVLLVWALDRPPKPLAGFLVASAGVAAGIAYSTGSRAAFLAIMMQTLVALAVLVRRSGVGSAAGLGAGSRATPTAGRLGAVRGGAVRDGAVAGGELRSGAVAGGEVRSGAVARGKVRSGAVAGGAVAAGAVAILIAVTVLVPSLRERNPLARLLIPSDSEVASSDSLRIALSRTGLRYWWEHPWLGTGAGTFETRLATELPRDVSNQAINVHNAFVEILSQYGIVVFTSFAVLLGVLAWRALRPARPTLLSDPRPTLPGDDPRSMLSDDDPRPALPGDEPRPALPGDDPRPALPADGPRVGSEIAIESANAPGRQRIYRLELAFLLFMMAVTALGVSSALALPMWFVMIAHATQLGRVLERPTQVGRVLERG